VHSFTRKFGILAFVLLCTSACTAVQASSRPPTKPRLTNIVVGPASHQLADFLTMAGDHVVVVPNGVYSAGDIEAPHPATNGPLKGWLVLMARSPGGVVVDLSNARLLLGPDTTRVMFVGFQFVNGSIFVAGQDIDFWYTEHTFPASSWSPSNDYSSSPDGVHVFATTARNVHFFGSDVHDVCDAFDVSNSSATVLVGVHVWDTSPMPGVCHNDAIDAVAGNTRNLTVLDSWLQGRVMLEDTHGPDTGVVFSNSWVSNSPSVGFTFTSDRVRVPRGIFGTRDGVRSWGNKSGEDRTEIIDGVQYWYANTQPSRVNVIDTNASTTPPPPGTISPPNQWRAANPYDSWPNLFNN
jgi:hypothetical protein